MDEFPAWARNAAWEVWKHIRFPARLDDGEHVQHIARALVAERERAAKIAMQKPPHLNYCDCGNTDREELQNEIAAAIRNGE